MQHEIKKHERGIAICKMANDCENRIKKYRKYAKSYYVSRHPNKNELSDYYVNLVDRYTTLKNYLLTRYKKTQPCTTQ